MSSGGSDSSALEFRVQPDAESAAADAAARIAERLRAAVEQRGRGTLALSGGRTPERMLVHLAAAGVPWARIAVFQVDERVAPAGPSRNWEAIRTRLAERVGLRDAQLHPLPVEQPDLVRAAREYAQTLAREAGAPPILDVVQLGLGSDGHTASLFAGDAALGAGGEEVLPTDVHAGWRRLTLGLSALDRARARVWLVSGADKRAALAQLRQGTAAIPANRVRRSGAIVVCDADAAGERPGAIG